MCSHCSSAMYELCIKHMKAKAPGPLTQASCFTGAPDKL